VVVDGGEMAAVVGPGADPMCGHRAEPAGLEVLLAEGLHLDGVLPFEGLGELYRLGGRVPFCAAVEAEGPAGEGHVHMDAVRFDTGGTGGGHAGVLGGLGGGPDLDDTVVAPPVGLDPRFRFELLDLIAGLRARAGITILLTTHYLDEAEQLCDRVTIVHRGRIVALDSPAALLTQLGREIVELRVDGDIARVMASLRAQGLAGDDAFAVGATLHVPVNGRPAAETVAAISDLRLAIAAITSRPPTLDDVYLRLTGESLAA
jgi:hypothetical protein